MQRIVLSCNAIVQVQIGAPDVRGRKQILELYLSNVPLHQVGTATTVATPSAPP